MNTNQTRSHRHVDIVRGEDVSAMLLHAATSGTILGTRDAAILVLLCAACLRNREVRRLQRSDVNANGDWIVIRQTDGFQRKIRLSTGAATLVRNWLVVRGDAPGPLFYCFRRMSRTGRQAISESAVGAVLRNWAVASGGNIFGNTDIRRTVLGQAKYGQERCCPVVFGADLLPLRYPDVSQISVPGPLRMDTAAAHYLSRLDAKTRRAATEALTLLVGTLGDSTSSIVFYPWSQLSRDQLQAALQSAPYRSAMLTRIRKALGGVLREAFRRGEMSMRRYDELAGWSWHANEKKPDSL